MAAETKSKGKKVESVFAPSFHKKVKSKLKKANTSFAQQTRDLFQKWLKETD